MTKPSKKAWYKRMWVYIAGGVLIALSIFLLIQGIQCHNAVIRSRECLVAYGAESADHFPSCTLVVFETGGHLLVGNGEEID